MSEETLFLPVNADERALILWLRGSKLGRDMAGLNDLLEEIEERGVDIRSVLRELPASVSTDGTDAALRALDSRVEMLEGLVEQLGTTSTPLPPTSPPAPAKPPAPVTKRTVLFDGVDVTARSNPRMFEAVLNHLVDSGLVRPGTQPLVAGRRRVLLASKPEHPSGKPFFRPVEVGGVFIETHYSAKDALARLGELADEVGVSFEVVEPDESPGAGPEAPAEPGANKPPSAPKRSYRSRSASRIPVFVIGDRQVHGGSVPALYDAALRAMVDQGLVDPARLPCGRGRKRYVLAQTPTHPSGKPFFTPVEYGGFAMEAHYSVDRGISALGEVLDELGIAHDVRKSATS